MSITIDMYTRDNVPANVLRLIRGYHSSLCQGQVSKSYTTGQIKKTKSDLYFVSVRHVGNLRSSAKRTKLMGFLLAQHRGTSLYIDVVCARQGHGGRLFKAAKKYALTHDKKTMSLSSLQVARTYWKKQQFQDVPASQVCRKQITLKKKGNEQHGFRMSLCLRPPAGQRVSQPSWSTWDWFFGK